MMSTQSPEWVAMAKLVSQFYSKADAEPFREPVAWQELGLFDYPQVVKKPMDLGLVKQKITEGKYKTIHEAAEDVRLIWRNCKAYNADGSDFYNLADNMEKKFEEKFEKICSTKEGSSMGGGHPVESVAEPTNDEKRAFAKGLYKITKEQLGQVIIDLENKCPKALVKNAAEDEVEINVDNISAVAFKEVMDYVNSCCATAGNGSSGGAPGGGTKKKAKATKRAKA